MSDNLSDLSDSINPEEHIIFLGKKTDFKKKEKIEKELSTSKLELEKQPENEPIKIKHKKINLNASKGIEESDSKEYIEEEEEEEEEGVSVQINASDNSDEEDLSRSQYSQNKKRKLEEVNQGPGWQRNWKDSNSNNNDNKSMSSSSAIVVNIDKTVKNNETNDNNDYNDKTIDNKLINDSTNAINLSNNNSFSKKTSFFITATDNTNKNNNIQNKNQIYIQNRNNNINTNTINNNFTQNPINANINLFHSQENKLPLDDKRNTNNIFNSNKPVFNSDDQYKTNSQVKPIPLKIPPLFNGQRFCTFMGEKYRKYGINLQKIPHDQIIALITENLKKYLQTYLLRLISISRIRNVNFNLYSNNQTGQIYYTFRTYNSEISLDKKSLNFVRGKDLDILFTSNYKKDMDLIDEYVELNNKKIKFEKLSSCKEKDEENDKVKGIESSIKITEGPNPSIKLLPGRRTKKKDNSFIKEFRKKIVQTQKKEDLIKQNSNTKNTLEAFLNETDTFPKNKSKGKNINSLLDESRINNRTDMSSRMSDNMSNMYSFTNSNINQIKNEIDMSVYKYFDPTKNENITKGQKRRINIKDFIYLLENSNEYIPKKAYLLNRAALEYNKKFN